MNDNARYRILIVDDEDEILQTLENLLAGLGYEVLVAGSAKRCLQILEREPKIDLVLLDVSLPDLNGIQVLREIKQRKEPPPVIMMTGGAETRIFEAQQVGAAAFLLKPFSIETLSATVETTLNARH